MKIKPTSEKAKSALKVSSRSHLGDTSCVPELRFPHFTTPWETTPLSRLLRFQNGVNAPAEKYGRGVKFVSVSDIIQNDYVTYDNIVGCVDIDDATLERYSVENGDMVFQRSSETVEDIGRANVYLDNRTATFGGFVIRGKKIGEYNPYFFKCLLYSNEARRKVIRAGAGAQHYNIGQEALSQIYLHFPEMAEQRRIADLLLLVSNRIDAQRKLVELLKKHKRGVIEQIFGRRLDMGENPEKWNVVELRDLFSKVARRNRGGKVKNVITNSAEFGLIPQRNFFDKSIAVDGNTDGYYVIRTGDFVYNPRKSTTAPFGPFNRYTGTEDGIISPLYTCLVPKGKANPEYLAWYFRSTAWHRYVYDNGSQGARHDRVNMTDDLLFGIPVLLPPIAVQERIANGLNAINARWSSANIVLAHLEKMKRGLLQQLFA